MMRLFNFFKKNNRATQNPAIGKSGRELDLKSMLSGEEMRLLLTDLNTVAGKAPGEGKAVVLTTAQMVQESGVIPVQGLDLCIAAVQDSLQTFAAFGMVPAGHAALLEKLKQMKTSI